MRQKKSRLERVGGASHQRNLSCAGHGARVATVFDLDIGSDPDDTVVAAMVALDPERFRPTLFITNDETPAHSRARFLAAVLARAGAHVPVAAGLPSERAKDDILVERAGLIPVAPPRGYEPDGVAALEHVLAGHEHVDYYGLGALTNLSAVLRRSPQLVSRIRLIQMGPAFAGLYRSSHRPQTNAGLDPRAFRHVLATLSMPAQLLMSHSSWSAYPGELVRQELGVYVDDPFFKAIESSERAVLRLLADHLRAWEESGVPCSIMHDPLTVLSTRGKLVGFADGRIHLDEEGFADLSACSRADLRRKGVRGPANWGEWLKRAPIITTEPRIPVRFSLATCYARARAELVRSLLGNEQGHVAQQWGDFNADSARRTE